MIRVDRVSKFYGTRRVLSDVTFDVARGTVTTLIGPSGSGKSTLLRCVNFLEHYESGSISIEGKMVGYYSADNGRKVRPITEIAAMRAEAVMVFQHMNLFSHMTAVQNVAIAPIRVRGIPRRLAEKQAEELLARVGLSHRMREYPGYLSGGEQQRVAIARALAMDPKILLLDEVTSALDPERVGEVLLVLEKLAAEGITMLVVTHEMGFARRASQQIVFMEDGIAAEIGGPEIMNKNGSPRLARFLEHVRYGVQ